MKIPIGKYLCHHFHLHHYWIPQPTHSEKIPFHIYRAGYYCRKCEAFRTIDYPWCKVCQLFMLHQHSHIPPDFYKVPAAPTCYLCHNTTFGDTSGLIPCTVCGKNVCAGCSNSSVMVTICRTCAILGFSPKFPAKHEPHIAVMFENQYQNEICKECGFPASDKDMHPWEV